jgi:hypothetical protein
MLCCLPKEEKLADVSSNLVFHTNFRSAENSKSTKIISQMTALKHGRYRIKAKAFL